MCNEWKPLSSGRWLDGSEEHGFIKNDVGHWDGREVREKHLSQCLIGSVERVASRGLPIHCTLLLQGSCFRQG